MGVPSAQAFVRQCKCTSRVTHANLVKYAARMKQLADRRRIPAPTYHVRSAHGCHLLRRHPDLLPDPQGTHHPRLSGPSTAAGEQALRQVREVRVRHGLRGVPGTHLGEGTGSGQPRESTGSGGVGATHRLYPAPALPRIRQFLPSLHPRFQPGRGPTHRPIPAVPHQDPEPQPSR